MRQSEQRVSFSAEAKKATFVTHIPSEKKVKKQFPYAVTHRIVSFLVTCNEKTLKSWSLDLSLKAGLSRKADFICLSSFVRLFRLVSREWREIVDQYFLLPFLLAHAYESRASARHRVCQLGVGYEAFRLDIDAMADDLPLWLSASDSKMPESSALFPPLQDVRMCYTESKNPGEFCEWIFVSLMQPDSSLRTLLAEFNPQESSKAHLKQAIESLQTLLNYDRVSRRFKVAQRVFIFLVLCGSVCRFLLGTAPFRTSEVRTWITLLLLVIAISLVNIVIAILLVNNGGWMMMPLPPSDSVLVNRISAFFLAELFDTNANPVLSHPLLLLHMLKGNGLFAQRFEPSQLPPKQPTTMTIPWEKRLAPVAQAKDSATAAASAF